MRRAQSDLHGKKLSSLLPEDLRAVLVFIVRTVRDRRGSLLQRALAITRAAVRSPWLSRDVRRILEGASGVFLLSEREREALAVDFGLDPKIGTLTPNGRPDNEFVFSPKINRILVVGRIESRKRQLDIALQASAKNIPVCFVGTPNLNEPEYVEAFEFAVARSSNLEWIRGIPHNSVLDIMRSSKVLLNCSWVEVQSLVDIEAAFSGCHVVTIENGGSSSEWLADAVTEIPSCSVDEALRIAYELALADNSPAMPNYDHTWESTTGVIRLEYALAAGTTARAVGKFG